MQAERRHRALSTSLIEGTAQCFALYAARRPNISGFNTNATTPPTLHRGSNSALRHYLRDEPLELRWRTFVLELDRDIPLRRAVGRRLPVVRNVHGRLLIEQPHAYDTSALPLSFQPHVCISHARPAQSAVVLTTGKQSIAVGVLRWRICQRRILL